MRIPFERPAEGMEDADETGHEVPGFVPFMEEPEDDLPKIGGLGVTGVFAGPPLTDLVVIILTIIMLISEFGSLSKLAAEKK